MSKMSRDKGARYEREIAGVFTDYGFVAERRLGQERDSGHDMNLLIPVHVECKRRQRVAINEWWEQAQRSCTAGETPVVVTRGDHSRNLAVLDLHDYLTLLQEVTIARGDE